jgi:hypothetical protein
MFIQQIKKPSGSEGSYFLMIRIIVFSDSGEEQEH